MRAEDGDPREARRLHYRRSAALREFVPARDAAHLARAGGPAPTARKATPYLVEPHHTRRLSDGGPDHPRWVAAICPNCHREVHHGAEGQENHRASRARLAEPEKARRR